MHEPDLAIMDEPTSGLDPLMQERFSEFLDAERERGLTVFLSSHVLGEGRRNCDRVGIVHIDEPVPVADLVAVHALSGPYLLACAAAGLVPSTAAHRSDTAKRGALGLIFALFLVESVAASTDYASLGRASPTR